MDRRLLVALVGLVEVLAPRRIAAFWIGLCCRNPDQVELRPWVIHAIRIEGLALLGWVAWQSRDAIDDTEPDRATIEEPTYQEESADTPAIDPDTRRFDIAAVLYHTDEPLSVAEVVDLSADTTWEIGRSTASATLYRMYNESLVDRAERDGEGRFEYWLTEDGRAAVESSDVTIEPNPFAD